jgi:hypothetical protein
VTRRFAAGLLAGALIGWYLNSRVYPAPYLREGPHPHQGYSVRRTRR